MEHKATHEQAKLQLELYDLRREAKMREARDWFFKNYWVDSMEDAMKLAGPHEGAQAGHPSAPPPVWKVPLVHGAHGVALLPSVSAVPGVQRELLQGPAEPAGRYAPAGQAVQPLAGSLLRLVVPAAQ